MRVQRACVLAAGKILMPKDFPIAPGPAAYASASFKEEPAIADQAIDTPPLSMIASAASDAAASSVPENLHQAVEILLNAAAANEELELLPWLEREMTLHAMRPDRRQPGPRRQAPRHHPGDPAQAA